ncbi:hypothetical protein [Fontivita pretiosa]|uniref:hypothetical protein n=1 Tax=Fontivita pretiosa TaxID=2989684 RepID=UPI003D1703A5
MRQIQTLTIGGIVSVWMMLTASQVVTAAEPRDWLVAASSIARLADDRIALMVPAARGNQRQLLISRDAHPVTLLDFEQPIIMFGEGGVLSARNPRCVAMAAAGDTLHVIASSGGKLSWYTAAVTGGGAAKWSSWSLESESDLEVDEAIVTPAGGVWVVYREQLGQDCGVAAATLRDGRITRMPIVRTQAAILSARGAVGDDEALQIVWAESELAPRVRLARLDTGNGEVAQVRTVGDGNAPDVLRVGQTTFVVSEQSDGSMLAEWTGPDAVRHVQELRGRAGVRPTLVADEHGVAWLFAVGLDRRAMYYRRFLGDGFGPECECNPVPGVWQLSGGFSAQPISGKSAASIALLEARFVEEPNEYRYIFANLPVPRYSVTDSRRVLFLDMLEVARIDNVQQKVATAVRSEANPLKLNGPSGWYDCAYAGYVNVIVEGDKFRMWYNGRSDEITPDRKFVMCYAESTDGIHWTKPELGLYEYKGTKKTNLIFPYESGACEPIVIRDDDDPDSSRRYKMVLEASYEGATCVYLSWSADGIHWQWPAHRLWGKAAGRNQTSKGFHPWLEPLLSFFRDPLEKNENYRWKMYGQDAYAGYPYPLPLRTRNLSLVHGATPYDMFGYIENPVLDPRTGHEEDQIHGGLVQPYEGMYVCLYQHWWDRDWKVDLRLAASRDGIHFTRVQPQTAVLPLGPDGSWDSGMLCTPNFLFARDGKLWLYYRGSIGTLATGRAIAKMQKSPHEQKYDPWTMMTGLARLRIDGFAFVTIAPMQYLPQPMRTTEVPDYRVPTMGTVTTIPINAEGIARQSLHVNLENFAPGFAWVRAQLRDADSEQVIAGYSFEDCDPLRQGSPDHVVSWRGSPKLDSVTAKRVRVEFQLHGALDSPQLYSFWFAEL